MCLQQALEFESQCNLRKISGNLFLFRNFSLSSNTSKIVAIQYWPDTRGKCPTGHFRHFQAGSIVFVNYYLGHPYEAQTNPKRHIIA